MQADKQQNSMMNMKLFSFFVGAATAISASAALAEFNVTILHTNDIHSRIESINKYDSTCNADGEAERKCFGGIARIKSAIDMQRSELSGQNILVLDTGDPFQGSLIQLIKVLQKRNSWKLLVTMPWLLEITSSMMGQKASQNL